METWTKKTGEAEELLVLYFVYTMDINTGWCGGKFNTVGGDSIGNCGKRKFVCTCD
jgi:hypothetical protein